MSVPVTDRYSDRTKYVGRAKAIVLDNKDPQKKGRIKVNHPLFGTSTWIPYLQLPFAFDIPEPKDVVYVECDGGFETNLVAWGKILGNGSEIQLPNEFKRAKPTNRGFYTPGGHLIEFDDGNSITTLGKGIRITTSDGSSISISEDPTDSKIILEKKEGAIVELDGVSDRITVKTQLGDELIVGASEGIQGTTPSGTSLVMNNGAINIEATNNKIDLTADGNINVENASGNKINATNTGEITAETVGGSKLTLDATSATLENSAGAKAELTPTEASLFTAAGAGIRASNTQVALGGPSAEVLDILSTFLQELATDTFAGFGSPAGKAALYATLATRLNTIKGSL